MTLILSFVNLVFVAVSATYIAGHFLGDHNTFWIGAWTVMLLVHAAQFINRYGQEVGK